MRNDFTLRTVEFITRPAGSVFTNIVISVEPERLIPDAPYITSKDVEDHIQAMLSSIGLDDLDPVDFFASGYKSYTCKLLIQTAYVSAFAMVFNKHCE